MEEDFQGALSRILEIVSSGTVRCSPQFIEDLAELEAEIRELEIELGINRMRLQERISQVPMEDRKELGELLAAQIT